MVNKDLNVATIYFSQVQNLKCRKQGINRHFPNLVYVVSGLQNKGYVAPVTYLDYSSA